MGVPALFRWLSKKYPKIIYPVVEEEGTTMQDGDGEDVEVPLNIMLPNPNGVEFDNLYLDMNGIVHPCTHPEGKPAPETEEDMMIEIFKYTDHIVNMIRPRKLLFMAIDGVAPRAKMNQQRSRRFRAAQDAKEKEEARKEALAMWEAMGKEVIDKGQEKEAWDSNAITPGTPFMDLLAASLRYWVVQKINTDPGWKKIQVIISDASVPGEGEHKIMDYIRRQRSNPGHDPNTRHVIYGLDADLIMLALATHEPHFRVLREDVFANDTSPSACRLCGQEGHYAAQCTGQKAEVKKKPPSDKKPFIFLDVAILREYLEVELDVPQAPFPFHVEQAIDDWVLLIFFVGNDFLPHLPSLEIREGAIDTLLRIWKQELPRMGGYMTNHGKLELSRAQIILEGLAKREDDIFRRRREAEERQDQNAKRRKLQEQQNGQNSIVGGPSPALALIAPPTAPSNTSNPIHPSLPQRPTYDFAASADSIGLGASLTAESIQNIPLATQALAGSNRDVVANRRAIRMANMSAAEVLKAELSGLSPLKPSLPQPASPPNISREAQPESESTEDADEVPGLGTHARSPIILAPPSPIKAEPSLADDKGQETTEPEAESDLHSELDESPDAIHAGLKRKFEEGPGSEESDVVEAEEDEEAVPGGRLALKVNPDGTVVQEDTVKLWEPGYRERYYKQKFGVELGDVEFRTQITHTYVEGLAWVLHYYYQGTASWHWYYPYHFAPFAADFQDVDQMSVKFELGQPFRPFEQLMGVFPAASRKHIPPAFQGFMVDEESPIIDFYPSTFEIDMNGKKMAWQGVALLPFIDEKRLLDAMALQYPNLTEEERRRNRWGNNVIYASDEHPIYPFYETLYGKRKTTQPQGIPTNLSSGMSGSVLPNPDCLPGSTYYNPLPTQDLPDIKNDRSLSVLCFYPKQLTPHRSVLLPGARRPPRALAPGDLETIRNGRGRGRGGWERGGAPGRGGYNAGLPERPRSDMFHSRPNGHGPQSHSYYGPDRRGRGSSGPPAPYYQGNSYSSYSSYTQSYSQTYSQQSYSGYGGGAPRGRPPQTYGGYEQSRSSYGRGGMSSQSYSQGGYGGYGSGPSHHGNSSYGGGSNYGDYGSGNVSYGAPRGRGRGW